MIMKEITVKELDTMLRKLGIGIKEMVEVTEYDRYEDWSCIKDFDKITDPDELQLLDEYQTVMRHLCDIYYTLLYQQREIIGEGVLSFNAQGYYEDKYHEYHCGDGIEYYFYDDWDEKYKWRTSRIEHNGNRYYIVGNPNIELKGLRVRHRKR
jgi:hypothetical protein PPSC2_c3493